MASSAPRGAERTIHQDYIARIRYSNALPPPPNPPKLLDIPNTGLASGQYTTPGFASRLARDQPLNIEADAELGMPLDLVGMPGIFDGDESSIQAPLHLPVPHPHDRALLRPLSTLGKPKFSDSGVSFLRRTEYISSYQSKSRFDSTTSKSLIDKTGVRAKKAAYNLDKESPEYVKSQIEKGFHTAESFVKEQFRVRHPTKRNLKLVDAHPLVPDLDAFPDAGGYISIKFLTNPVPSSSTYDIRLEHTLLRPVAPSEDEQAAKDAMREAHERDPERNPAPIESIDYELYITQSAKDAQSFKRKFSTFDDDRDEESLYPSKDTSGQGVFRFNRVRAYESASQVGSVYEKYDDEVLLAVHDGSDGQHQKAAYYYPIVQRTSIRPQRNKNIHRGKGFYGNADAEELNTDHIELRIEAPTEEMISNRAIYKEHPFGAEEDTGANGERSRKEDAGSSPPEGQDDDDDPKSD